MRISAYACSPAHDLGVKGDSVEHNQSPPNFGSYPRAARRRLGYNAFTTIAKRWKFCAVIRRRLYLFVAAWTDSVDPCFWPCCSVRR